MPTKFFLLTQLFYHASASQTANLWQAITNGPQAASIIDVSATATTYVLGCADNFPAEVSGYKKEELCSPLASLTITQGPSTLAYVTAVNMAMTDPAPPTMVKESMNCVLSATTAAVCTIKYDGANKIVVPGDLAPDMAASMKSQLDLLKTAQTSTLLGADYPLFGPVEVTAGAEKLSGGVKQVSTVDGTGEAGASARPSRQPSSSSSPVVDGASIQTNPAGGGVNTTVPKTTSSGES